MSGFTCTVDKQHFAVSACICSFPLPLLCESHASKHSNDEHLLLPLEVVHYIRSPEQLQRYRQWLFRIISNFTAMKYCRNDMKTLEDKVESAYAEICDEANRQREALLQGIRRAYSAFSDSLDAAIQLVWEHALDMTWEPSTFLAAMIWQREAKELISSQVYSFTVWGKRDLVSAVLGAELRFDGIEELKEYGFQSEGKEASKEDASLIREQQAKIDLIVEELRQSQDKIQQLQADLATMHSKTKAFQVQKEEYEREIATLKGENAQMIQKLDERKQEMTTNRWFSEMEEETQFKNIALERELAAAMSKLSEKQAENKQLQMITGENQRKEEKLQGKIRDLSAELAEFKPKLPHGCVLYSDSLSDFPLSKTTLTPLPSETVFYQPAVQLPNGDIYIGQWSKEGERHGLGTCYYHSGNVVEGVWARDQQTCWMSVYAKNGNVYVGGGQQGMREGVGVMKYEDGSTYVGEWSGDKKHGSGTTRNAMKGTNYFGEWVEGVRHGKGVLFCKNGDMYAGDFFKDRREGKGMERFAYGKIRAGSYRQGKLLSSNRQTLLHSSSIPSDLQFESTQLYKSLEDVEYVENSLGIEGTAILRKVAGQWSNFSPEMADIVLGVVYEHWQKGEEKVRLVLKSMGCCFKSLS